jgi:Druantia protein DruA
MNVIFTYRKKATTRDDIAFISEVIKKHWDKGRTAISRILCDAWDWRQANGYLKDGVCRGLLLKLEQEQHITLPPRIIFNNTSRNKNSRQPTLDFCPNPISDTLPNLGPIELRQVRRTPEEKLFNSLIRQYHYLGYTQPVGEHLKYLAYAAGRVVACLAFASAPYAIDCRDTYLAWSAEARERNRNLLAYNTRFLILPWVTVPHLVSHLLGRIARIISEDWQRLYHHPILWLETFIDTERFTGTCYRAANWTLLGLTSGRGKYNKTRKKLTTIKAMYGYPLCRDFRRRLCHG